MKAGSRLERHLQISAALVILGLLVEALCMVWARPLGFVAFVSMSGPLILAGVAIYLYSIVAGHLSSD